MQRLVDQRCLNHPMREAAARCPACRQFFCRECVTEHEDRVICAACLDRLTRPGGSRRTRLEIFAALGQCLAGLVVAWVFFYAVGRGLLALPDAWHEGTVWVNPNHDE